MDNFYKNDLNNLKFNFKKINCNFFLKENGKINYYNLHHLRIYLCLFNNNIKYIKSNYFFDLYNNDYVIKSLLIISYIQKNSNLKYINSPYFSYIYNNSVKNTEDNILNILFIQERIFKEKNISFINILSFHFLMLKFQYNKTVSDKDLLIEIFYNNFIKDKFIINDIKKNYNKNILIDFANYHELYLFLKDKGYVKKFYNEYYDKILTNYNKMYNKYIINNKDELSKYKSKKIGSIKNFNSINLEDYIDKLINNNLDKDYIKYKFIELKKKYNI